MAQAPTPTPAAAEPAQPKRAAPKRAAPKRAFGRSLSDFPNLSAVEKDLVARCARGEPCVLGNGQLPDAATLANTVRAELIRFLSLGGDAAHSVHEEGVMLRGGWITGELSLHQAQASVRLDLRYCHFDTPPNFRAARLPELGLSGSSVPGLNADRMTVTGGVFLDNGFAATGEVRLLGAQIGSNLECRRGSFANAGGKALIADRTTVAGSVFLRDGFAATGEVRLVGAQIGSTLSCIGGTFSGAGGRALSADRMTVAGGVFLRGGFAATGEVRLLGTQIGGDLSCSGGSFTNSMGRALNADGMGVAGSVFLRGATILGAVDLATAKIGTLADDAAFWQAGGHMLDGLRYDRIVGPTDAKMRIDWLGDKQRASHRTTDFRPQPWEQLITVLRAMGHPGEAAEVAIAKQKQLRVARWTHKWALRNYINGGLHWLYGVLAGYGHRPLRIVYWMAAVFAIFSLAFYAGRNGGYFGPTSPLIHASPAFEMCGTPGETDAKGQAKPFWTSPACPTPPEYTTFQPFLYSLDLILPLVDLHQESDWAPLVVNPAGKTLWLGRILRWMMWFEILFGWVASLTLVAVLGRLVDKD